MWRNISASMLDQVILSGLALGINLALITFSTPVEFGRYIIALSVLLVLTSVQGALIATPLIIGVPRAPESRKPAIISAAASVNLALLALSIVAALAVGGLVAPDGVHMIAMAALVATGLQRELARSVLIALDRMPRCLVLDAAFGASALLAIPILWQVMPPAAATMAGMAAANAVAVLLFAPAMGRTLRHPRRTLAVYGTYWEEARWSLAGAVTAEVQNRVYIFIVEAFRGTAALGVLQAGRVITSPITLLAPTWGRAALPRMSAMLGSGQRDQALAILGWGIVLTMGAALAYSVLLYFGWSYFESLVFRGRYPQIDTLVLGWAVYSLISVPRGCIAEFLFAEKRLRELAVIIFAAAMVSSTLLMSLATPVSIGTAILCLIVGEAIMLAWMMALLVRTPKVAAAE